MKLKLDDNGNAVVKDGKLVMIDDDNDDKEITFDVVDGYSSLSKANHEAASRRKEIKALEKKMKAFEGIEDPEAAIEALSKVQSMDKDVEAQIAANKAHYEKTTKKLTEERDQRIAELSGQVFQLKVGDKFHTSEAVKKTIYQPHDAAQIFGKNFEIEDGQVVGKLDGQVILSKENPGKAAGFDEAFSAMIDARPDKDNLLRPTGQQGSGSPARQPRGKIGGDQGAQKTGVDKIKSGLSGIQRGNKNDPGPPES